MAEFKNSLKAKTGTSPIVHIGIILCGLVGGYLYFSQFINNADLPAVIKPATVVPGAEVEPEDTPTKFKNEANFNFDLFKSAAFKTLTVYGEVPVKVGEKGKSDLFAPF